MVDETPLKPEVASQEDTSTTDVPQVVTDNTVTTPSESLAQTPSVSTTDKQKTDEQDTPPVAGADKKKEKKAKSAKKSQKTKAKYYIPVEVGQELQGKIKTITDFGAFVDINMAVDGLVHISELARRRVEKVSDVVSEGEEVTVWVKSVDKERGRVGLTMLKPIAIKYSDVSEGAVFDGEVKRIESYGVFVDVGLEREGLIHVSELDHEYIKHPGDVVSEGEVISVKVLKVDAKKKQVNLSRKALIEAPEPEVVEVVEEEEEFDVEQEPIPTSMAVAFGLLDTGKKQSKKKQAKHRKRNKSMDEVVRKTLKVQQD